MKLRLSTLGRGTLLFAALSCVCIAACGHSSSSESSAQGTTAPQAATFPPAPAAETTGGFDGARAYKHVEQLVAIGPHSAGSEGIRRAQEYIVGQLKSFGCPVEEQDFHAPSTPADDGWSPDRSGDRSETARHPPADLPASASRHTASGDRHDHLDDRVLFGRSRDDRMEGRRLGGG